MALKTKVRADQVVSREDGVIEWITDSGKMTKTPEKEIQVLEAVAKTTEEPAEEPAPEPKPTPPKKITSKAVKQVKPVPAPVPQAPPVAKSTNQQKTPQEMKPAKPEKEKIVAKAKPKAKTTGVRTIGGKEVDLSKYNKVKAPGGGVSYNIGDTTAKKLEGKTLDEVYKIVAKDTKQDEKELRAKYKHLNAGMQRMALGNMHRKGPRTEKEKKKAA